LGFEGGNRLDGCDETVASPGQRLDEARRLSDVAECRPEFSDGVVHALLEVDKRLAAPERTLEIVPRDDNSRALQ